MAADLAPTPTTGLRVQACGDAHIANFGGFATPERRDVFDVNDFDETLPTPWEWDVKRLAASAIVAARDNKLHRRDQRAAAGEAMRAYRERMHVVDIRAMAKGRAGSPPITDQPPLIFHPRKATERALTHQMHSAHSRYRTTLETNAATLLDRFAFVDLAMKVVGIGSVGTRFGIALLSAGPKGARASVLEPYAGTSRFANNGKRVVVGQRLMQSASDIFLGWAKARDGRQYYIRQLRDGKVKPLIAQYDATRLAEYAAACGWALAGAHARTGDATQIAGYLGKSRAFDTSITRFAERYADQTERDYEALVAAVRKGRVAAEKNPTKV